ncbi:MAG: extracellular solute-binding protein, partial [Acetobacteraceae bacterium]|nr:extracellular solute-binding protein [Acetobacteraceae bacterium]
TLCRNLKKIGHPCGFALSHAPGDAPGYANWLLWSHGGKLANEDGSLALDSKETRAAIDYARAMQETMIAGTMSWNGASNNQAFAAGNIALTQNGVSIYYAAKNTPGQAAIAADMDHSEMPYGAAKAAPASCLVMNAMVFKHTKYPNAAKDYLRFMMEAPQFDPWLTGSLGYWCQPLRAYAESDVWKSDPKIAVFRNAMATPFNDAYAGPISQASSAVYNDWVLVDMFARVVTGESGPEDSIRQAVRAAGRYYKA